MVIGEAAARPGRGRGLRGNPRADLVSRLGLDAVRRREKGMYVICTCYVRDIAALFTLESQQSLPQTAVGRRLLRRVANAAVARRVDAPRQAVYQLGA